ncbi:MAG: hypothetical protein SOW59_05420, partial [Corynebacterium sp.]|nr:hypothetical protein [Corynebacterium sp.]
MPRLVNSSATLAVALAFIACVTWPFFLPGELLHRDMAVVEHFGRIAANFGAGELPARNVPQDAVLSVLPFPVILVKGLLVASASVAAYGGWCLARLGTPQGTTWPAVALAVCNPYVIERLLQGHWSVAVAAWWLPVLVAASLSRRWWLAWLGLWVVSLTPTGLLLGTIAVVVCGAGRRVLTAGIALLLSMPWLVPGVIAAVRPNVSANAAMDSLAAVTMFAPRAEEAVGTLGSLLSLGGIWNGHAVPDSRHVGFALFGLVLVALAMWGLRRVHRETLVPVVVVAVCGLIIPLAAWLWPQGLAQVIEHVPGAGLLRDSQKFIILVLPLYLVGLGGLRHPLALGAVALVLLQTPDAARSVSELRPHIDSEINYRLAAEI